MPSFTRTPLKLAALLAALPLPAQADEADTQAALDEITVSATRTGTSAKDTPAAVYTVRQDQIQHHQMQVDLSESLAAVPGVQIKNRRNYAQDTQISVRGFGARTAFGVRGVRIYVDDIPATLPDGQGAISHIDLGSARRIEVLNGPMSALYGNASGGVMLVQSEEGQNPPSIETHANAGRYGTYQYGIKASGGGNGKELPAYMLSLARFQTDGYRDHSSAFKNMANANVKWQLDNGATLKLIANSVNTRADDPQGLTRAQWQQNPRQASPSAIAYNVRKEQQQVQGGLVYEQALDAHHSIKAVLYGGERKALQFQSIPKAVQQNNPGHAGGVIDLRRRYYGADVRWSGQNLLADESLRASVGLSFDTLTEKRRGYENFIGDTLGAQGVLRRNETNDIWNLDPYMQAGWQFAPQWRLDGGLRYSNVHFKSRDHYITAANPDDSGQTDYRKWLPSATLSWQATERLLGYTSYARGFETPTMNELSYRDEGSGLNFGLQPASNQTYEIGAKYSGWLGGLASVAAFRINTDNEIVVKSSSNGRTVYQNAGKTRRHGIELAWSGEIAPDLNATLAYTWLDARYKSDSANLANNKRIPGIAEHAAYLGADYAPEQGWQAGAGVRALSKVYVNDANSEAAPGFLTADIHAGYVWRLAGGWHIRSYAALNNLFNRQYIGSVIVNDGNGRYFEPAPGRNWQAGLSVKKAF